MYRLFFCRQVEIAFNDEEKYPGAVTSLRIKADAGSLCSVGVVDKSVHLLGGANTLTLQQVRACPDAETLNEQHVIR